VQPLARTAPSAAIWSTATVAGALASSWTLYGLGFGRGVVRLVHELE
jgi:hypothetical protein